jgi:thiopeptide-type bacteriocin biosynthesis protein
MLSSERADSQKNGGTTPTTGLPSQDGTGCAMLASSWVRTVDVQIGAERLSLADFLMRCAQSIENHGRSASPTAELISIRDAFLSAGLPALQMSASGSVWLQYGFSAGQPCRRLYYELATTVGDLLDDKDIGEFFFMHKPPGLRVRFETAGAKRARLQAVLEERFCQWRDQGLIDQWNPAVYEPEAYLFGGPISMRSVHGLFTADSMAWLAFHALAEDDATTHARGPAWAISLAMLRGLFDALKIVGWEDLDVWDRVRWQTGRRLEGQDNVSAGFSQLVGLLRQAWSQPDALRELFSPKIQEVLDVYRRSVEEEAARWRSDYFSTTGALIGPREAAAYIIVFHWNRGGFSVIRQAMIAEALAMRTWDGHA